MRSELGIGDANVLNMAEKEKEGFDIVDFYLYIWLETNEGVIPF